MENNNNVNTETNNESSAAEQNQNTTTETSTETTVAYKELYEQQANSIKELQKEISELKVANAKLAIQQSISTPKCSTEELLNKMF